MTALKEIDALNKNGFVLEGNEQVIYKGNDFFMIVIRGVPGIAEIISHPGKYQIIV